MSKAVLVTGGNGFIGRFVVEELLARGRHVTVMDTRHREPIKGANLLLGDIRDATSVTEAVAHADGVIHLAGVLGTQETIANPLPAAETNIFGGLNMLQACNQYDVPLVVITVGNYWMNNTYSITKSTIERFADMINKYRNGRVSVVRALNAYGPRQAAAAPFGPSKVRKVMPSFACRALSGQPIEVYGDGNQIMDMIYVADVARTLVAALEYTEEHGASSLLEAGTGRKTTVNDIAHAVIREAAIVTGQPVDLIHLPMRPGEDPNSTVLGDPSTLSYVGIDSNELVPLEVGVRLSIEYFAKYLAEQKA
jgi:UDP-glucose 4-epimerase